MSEEDQPKKRRKLALELSVGIVIVLVCLGAYFGPKVYRAIVVARLERKLAAASSHDQRRALIEDLARLRCSEADAALRRYAHSSVLCAWVPESDGYKGIVIASESEFHVWHFRWNRKGYDTSGVGPLSWQPEFRGVEWTGNALRIDFKVPDKLSEHYGLPKGKLWSISLSEEETYELPLTNRFMSAAAIKSAGSREFPELQLFEFREGGGRSWSRE